MIVVMVMIVVMIVAMILLVTPLPIVLLIVLIESAVVTIRVAVVLGRPLPVVAFLSITPVVIGVEVRCPVHGATQPTRKEQPPKLDSFKSYRSEVTRPPRNMIL